MKKLTWSNWVKENFSKKNDENYYISLEEIFNGVAYTDLSHYTQEEVEREFDEYQKLYES